MKRAGTCLNFEHDSVTMFKKKIPLRCTSSGHYHIPITRPLPDRGKLKHILLVKEISSKNKSEKVKVATKLHRQFSHPSSKKLCDLVRNAGIRDPEFMKILQALPNSCEVCIRYKKNEPRPIVGFPLGSYFNETVAMDIKEINGNKVLHLIDHATRYSVGVRIPSKERSDIISAMFKHWIAYFGTPGSILTDNGREFDNESFRDMAQNLNIVVRTTAAESPWSNGLNERHNGILGEMVKKTVEDTNCSFEIALAWAISAKNTLHSAHGFSPNQLVFGRNPNLPSFLNDKLPALEGVSTSEIVASNLNAMHAARKQFIMCESSEKLRRALRHQVRTSTTQSYKNGDVFYKRNFCDRWLGPGTVIGWEHKQVLVKHGGTYVRVHPCRLVSHPETYQSSSESEAISESTTSQSEPEGSSNLSMSDENDVAEEPGTLNDHVAQHQTVREAHVLPKQNPIHKTITLPKPGQSIKCKLANDDDSEWRTLNVISRAGKATGKNKHLMNVAMEQGEPFWLDFNHGVLEWKENKARPINKDEATSSDEENIMISSSNHDLEMARENELQSWVENKVYTQVPDQGQCKISTRWVYTNKNVNGKQIYKARLVARGFQERDAGNIRNDSPTCSKESLRIALAIMASNHWVCKSMDIKTAFLQSKELDRLIYLHPPKEAKVPPGYIWKLSKCVYGLTDASRSWYLTLKEELLKSGAVVSKYDQAIFTWNFGNKLHGIIATHVDDFCFAGSEIFQSRVMDRIRHLFRIKSEEVAEFQYIGLSIKKTGNDVKLGQDEYVKKLRCIPLEPGRNLKDAISSTEVTETRQLIGQLNWLATQTRPDLSYDVSELSSILKQENVECLKQANRVVKKAKKEKSHIDIPDLGNLEHLKIIAYSDASFGNLTDGGSQGGYILFLVGSNDKYMPIAWQSKRIRRVVKSTLAAETLAMVDMAEACIFYRKLLLEILQLNDDTNNIKIFCKTDNSCLYDSVHSSTQILDKRLRIEMAILREMIDRKEIAEISWISTDVQIADSLTKKGVPSFKILGFISEPKESSV